MRRALVIALLAVLALPASAVASPGDAKRARAGLAAAVEKQRLTEAEARRYRAAVARARSLERRLPAARAEVLGAVLAQVARYRGRYTSPRALTLFSMLEANAARLNAHVSAGRAEEAGRLAHALLERGVSRLRGTAWEYWFDYGAARAPWTSGMAQAVMAQAFARAGDLGAARSAFLPVPRLTMSLADGPWVNLYEGWRLVVLNAQLQTTVSVAEYAGLAGDAQADAFAARLRSSATALLPFFDTGYWSNYSLSSESTLGYQRYVVTLLRRLKRDTGEEHWGEAAGRFEAYEREAPLLRAGPAVATLYPVPRDGHRDAAAVRFWISKISDVTLVVGGKWRRTIRASKGWHTLTWTVPATLPPGSHRVWLVARGLAGNLGRVDLPEVVVARDTESPEVSAAVGGGRLHWRGKDEGSGRLRLVLQLRGGGRTARLDLGLRPLNGAWRLRLPKGRWWAVLVAHDMSGNETSVPLGRVA